ncbi:MAG TPA: hypothetical protein VK809_02485 [Bacteroidia bacterium]|jgi:hypothetical protein|nr:hypothetical protein [Bacteroidia bacterium]
MKKAIGNTLVIKRPFEIKQALIFAAMNNKKTTLFGTAETTIGLAKETLGRRHGPDESEFNSNHSKLDC